MIQPHLVPFHKGNGTGGTLGTRPVNDFQGYDTPEILNSGQGCQFTSKEWTDACALYTEMKISMDDRSRAKDNVWIESFWITIKIRVNLHPAGGKRRGPVLWNQEIPDVASEHRINLLIMPSGQEEKATGLYRALLHTGRNLSDAEVRILEIIDKND